MGLRGFKADKTLNRILQEVYEEFKDQGVSREQVSDVFYMYFKIVREVMKSWDFPTIKIPYLGHIQSSPARLKSLHKRVMKSPAENKVEVGERIYKAMERRESEIVRRKKQKK